MEGGRGFVGLYPAALEELAEVLMAMWCAYIILHQASLFRCLSRVGQRGLQYFLASLSTHWVHITARGEELRL